MYERAHRTTLSEETRESLHEVRERVERFMEEKPEVVGLTLYGSNIKGTARNTIDNADYWSDLDCTLFVEVEDVNSDVSGLAAEFKERMDLAFPDYEVDIEMINPEIVLRNVHALVAAYSTKPNSGSIISEPLAKLFRFALAEGKIPKYRELVLDSIEAEVAEKNRQIEAENATGRYMETTWRYSADDAWRHIADNLYFWEFGEKGQEPPFDRDARFSRHYPQTIDAARRAFLS